VIVACVFYCKVLSNFEMFNSSIALSLLLLMCWLINYRFHHFETLLNSGVATAVTFWYKVSDSRYSFVLRVIIDLFCWHVFMRFCQHYRYLFSSHSSFGFCGTSQESGLTNAMISVWWVMLCRNDFVTVHKHPQMVPCFIARCIDMLWPFGFSVTLVICLKKARHIIVLFTTCKLHYSSFLVTIAAVKLWQS